MSCTDCSLHKECSNAFISGKGSKPKNTDIMIVQDCPTFLEDRSGKPLVGDLGKKLNYFLEKAGINYKTVYFTHAVKCGPKNPSSEIKNKHMDECSKYLMHEIIQHKPKVIIAMGKFAYQTFSGRTSIGEFAGHFDDFELDVTNELGREVTHKFKIMPTYSLNQSVKNKWEYTPDILRHMQKAVKYAQTGEIDMLPKPKVNLILSVKALDEFVERMKKAKYVSTDFETTGFHFWTDKIINAGYCSELGKADVIYLNPYKKEHTKKWKKKDRVLASKINKFLRENRDYIYEKVKEVNALPNLRLILHNGKFDSRFASKYGIPYRNFWYDSLPASSLIDENFRHALNVCAERHDINFGAYDVALWPYTGKNEKKKKSYQFVPPTMLVEYLGLDVEITMRLFKKQIPLLKREGMLEHLLNVKMPSLRNIKKVEFKGVKADRKLILKASKIIQGKQVQIQSKLNEITGIEGFNANSPKQINEFFIENSYPLKKLQIKETKSGFSTAATELEKFLPYKKYKEFPQLILNYKKLSKIKGTYVDGKHGLGGMLQYLDDKDRIHANFNLWTARTGRYSCNSPSLQVWPRPIKGLPNIRHAIIPTNKNWILFEADYSALEQYVVAALSKDPVLIKKLQDGTDMHCFNASELGLKLNTIPKWSTYDHLMVTNGKADDLKLEKGYDDQQIKNFIQDVEKHGEGVNWKELRTQAKGIGFGLNYGKGAKSFSDDFGITLDEAEEMIAAYFEIYEGMYQWREGIVYDALNKGEIKLLNGRKRRFHAAVDWLKSDWADDCWSAKILKESIARQAMNYPVQGGAHVVFEEACLRLTNRLRKEGLKARLLISIHDGIIGECPREEIFKVNQCIREEMPTTFHKGTEHELSLIIDVDNYKREWYGEKYGKGELEKELLGA